MWRLSLAGSVLALLPGCTPAPAAPAPPRLTAAGLLERVQCASVERFLPGTVSRDQRAEVKLTHRPDGSLWLYGVIEKSAEGAADWNIYILERRGGAWSAPIPAPFNSTANDFDPFFAPDGSGVYFFSNRPGGAGGDDLYFVPHEGGVFGSAENLRSLNTAGDDWAPVTDPAHGRLVFSTNGLGGAGRHDLYLSERAPGGGWGAPRPLTALNSPLEDFDATFVGPDLLIFARGDLEADRSSLYVAELGGAAPAPLPEALSPAGGFTLGPWYDGAGTLYYTAYRPERPEALVDIYAAALGRPGAGPCASGSP